MQIYLNGTAQEVADALSMADLVEQLGLTGRRIAVEVNQELVPRSLYPGHRLADQDRVEIIHAVGGG